MKKFNVSRRLFNAGLTGSILTMGNVASAGQVLVAGIYTVPIQQKRVARLHLALDAAAKRGEIDYVYSESTANTDYKSDENIGTVV